MAYKFQAGEAILSGNLLQEGDVEIETGFSLKVHEQTILDTSRNLGNVGTISGSGQISGPSLAVDLDATVGADIIMSQGGNVYLAGDGGAAKILSSGGNAVSIFGAKVVTNGSSIEPDSDGGTDLGSSSKQFADLYLSSELKMGNAVITEAELEQIDGITAGTVAASKAVVVDSNKDITGLRNVTATGYFEIGSAQLTESEMEMLDGITAGTAAASKAVVLDANKDVTGLRDISGRDLTLSGLNEGLVTFAQSNGKLGDDDAMAYNDDGMGGGKFFQVRSRGPVGNNFTGIMAKTASISVLNAAEDGLLAYVGYDGALSASSKLEVGGTVQFDGVADAAMVASDSMYFLDSDGKMKRDLASDVRNLFFSAVSGDATVAAGGALTIAADAVESGMLNDNVISGQTELAADGLAAADELLISDGGTLKKIGVDNLFLDGPGLLAEAALAVADDYIMFLDGGATGDAKKESVSDLMASVAGTGLKAASGVLALDAQELSQAAVASGDFFVFEDATDNSTKKESVDDLATLFAGTGLAAASAVLSLDLNELGAATVAVGDDSIAIIDATDNSTKKESITDLVAAMAGSGLSATNGVLSTQGSSVAVAVDGGTLSEGYNFATGSLSLSVTLPSGSAGDVIHVKAAALGDDQTLTINRQGSQTIDGATSIVLESPNAAVECIYVSGSTGNLWKIF